MTTQAPSNTEWWKATKQPAQPQPQGRGNTVVSPSDESRIQYGYGAGTNLTTEANRALDYGTNANQQYGDLGSLQRAGSYQSGSSYARQLSDLAYRLNAAGGANQQQAFGAGNAAAQYGGRVGGLLNAYGSNIAGQAGGYGAQAASDYGMQGMSREDQIRALQELSARANAPMGPSAAQAQLSAAADQNMANSLALARSGRGAGESAAALRQAGFQNAAIQQQTAQQAALLRAQEEQAYRQQQLDAANAAQAGYGNVRAADVGSMAQNLAQQQQLAALAQQYRTSGANAGMQGQQLQQGYGQQALGYTQLGQEGLQNLQGLGAQTGLGYANLGEQTGLAYSQLGEQARSYGLSLRDQILANQRNTYSNVLNTGISSEAQRVASANAAQQQLVGSVVGGIGTVAGSGLMIASDERLKTGIRPGAADADEMFRKLQALSWRYKGEDEGTRRVGPMAQDLERTEHGRSMVEDTPGGKMVDTGALALATAGEVAQLRKDLDALLKRRK
jgi:hypothetical protein